MIKSIRDGICGKHAAIRSDKGCVACRLVRFRSDNTQLHRLLSYVMCQTPAPEPMSSNVDDCIALIQDMKDRIKELEAEVELLRELVE